jgi:hypothetical protein
VGFDNEFPRSSVTFFLPLCPGIIKVSEVVFKISWKAYLNKGFYTVTKNPVMPAGENVLVP